ncbi:scavenger receptor cysteine-rich type 1 protein M160-like [Montipora capricornis]|uniref:scavenger receptor cysteine-rich type 1 protein M160-like n=1 Tax=Montipora capricornis TaxID=246305 RepID=UPI0035F12E7A
MSEVQCVGTEKTLQQCQYSDMVNSRGRYGVGVVCKSHYFYTGDIDIPIRLQGSMLPNTGRVEVFYAGVWGSISSDNWDMNDATVVCRQLGYRDGAEVALKNRVYGPFFGPVWLTNLRCTGNEKSVMDCAHDAIGNKSEEMPTTRFASVICKDGKMLRELNLRLKGSHLPNMGRVEVHFDGKWGSIYPWSSSSSSNKTTAMNVVCRQLGYAAASWSGVGLFCSDNDVLILPWFTNLRCSGSETSLNQCGLEFHTSTVVSCMSVHCTNEMADTGYGLRLHGSSVSHAGRVEIRIRGIWGSIYLQAYRLRFLSKSLLVICRQLGFNDSILWTGWPRSGPEISPQWFLSYNVRCLGNERNLMDCVSSTQPRLGRYDRYQDLGVVCKPNVSQIKDFQVRLTGSSLPFAGTIEVSYYGVWGGIFGYGVDIRVGHVICRQLGYSGVQQVFQHTVFGKGKGPLLMSRMTCNGNESELSQCTSETRDTRWYYYLEGKYFYAGGVLCVDANVGISKDFSVRLAGSPISNAGRVEVFYAGIWGTIDGYPWSMIDAHVVCRQLGYPRAISSGRSDQFGFGKSAVWFRNVRCLGNESTFQECPKSVAAYLANPYWATVLCKLPYQQGTSQNCSNVKCKSNGKCINTLAGAVCNCTDGFSGLQCEIPLFNPCQSSCQNGGQCFRNESSFLCACPKGLTGKLCEEKIVNAVNPCLSRPCTNKTSCYQNGTLTIKDGNLSEIGGNSTSVKRKAAIIIAISASIVVVLVAVVVCLVFEIRRLNTQLTSRPSATTKIYNNYAFQADPVNDVPEGSSTSLTHRDLGLGYANDGGENDHEYDIVLEMSSRPLPEIPTESQRSDPLPRIGKSPVYDNVEEQKSESTAVRYAGSQGRGMNSAEVTVAEPASYMSLSSKKPEHHDGEYSGLTYNGEVAIAPKQKTKKGKNNVRLYANA